ncbi:MAG: YqgE/AlgH family protein [Oceanospirillaceae bacterium]|nr:YqgE/AlgH family protein [Oceanospirillaceae bacterium]
MPPKQPSLRDHFLISMPHMHDLHFAQTVTYICDHSEYGAMGIVINRQIDLQLNDLLKHLELEREIQVRDNRPIYAGGPVQGERGFVLHRTPQGTTPPWLASYQVTDEVCLTTSIDILEAIACGSGPSDALIALGYAGWGAGQLEREISENAWLSCPANLDIIFRIPADERLQAAASTLGINLDLLTAQAGHA